MSRTFFNRRVAKSWKSHKKLYNIVKDIFNRGVLC